MFGLITLAKNAAYSGVRRPGRSFATFRERSAKDIWLSDTGAYPIIGIIGFAVLLACGKTIHSLFDPDAQLLKVDRKALFRGNLRDVNPDIAEEVAHEN